MAALVLNPFRVIRRRRRLARAIEEEVAWLRRRHGEGAYEAALAETRRTDLTDWGRQVKAGAARQLQPPEPVTDP